MRGRKYPSGLYDRKMYGEVKQYREEGFDSLSENTVLPEFLDKIFTCSSEDLDFIPDNSVHLCITSPPYNVNKEYDEDYSLSEYLDFLERVFAQVYRKLAVGGRFCVNVANVGRKPYIPLHGYIVARCIGLGFLMRGEIIWNKSTGAGISTAWGSWRKASNPALRDVHEYISVFSKGNYKREGGLSTISGEEFAEFTKSVWNMRTVSAKSAGHPAPFPIELPNRLIKLYSFENDIVLDPFCGSGTTCVAALRLNRRYIGIDIDDKYVQLANQRLNHAYVDKKLKEAWQVTMDINEFLETAKGFVSAERFERSKNYHYQRHDCQVSGTDVKVDMDLSVKRENDTSIIKLGLCPHCKTLFYHEDFDTRSV